MSSAISVAARRSSSLRRHRVAGRRRRQRNPAFYQAHSGSFAVFVDSSGELGRRTSHFAIGQGRVAADWGDNPGRRERQAREILEANDAWPPIEGLVYAIQIDQDSPPTEVLRRERAAFLRAYNGRTAVFRCLGGRLVEQTRPVRSSSYPGSTADLLHVGGRDRSSSRGCQNMPPDEAARFRTAVRGGSRYFYLLVRRPNERYGIDKR